MSVYSVLIIEFVCIALHAPVFAYALIFAFALVFKTICISICTYVHICIHKCVYMYMRMYTWSIMDFVFKNYHHIHICIGMDV